RAAARLPVFSLPLRRGGRRADKAQCPDYSGRGVRITPDEGRETSRPAPCGAPTRHLGLYAFDRGRTGPAPSGRRGYPSTARGRWLRKSFARRCRSRSPPPQGAPRRGERERGTIVTLWVKSSAISLADQLFRAPKAEFPVPMRSRALSMTILWQDPRCYATNSLQRRKSWQVPGTIEPNDSLPARQGAGAACPR